MCGLHMQNHFYSLFLKVWRMEAKIKLLPVLQILILFSEGLLVSWELQCVIRDIRVNSYLKHEMVINSCNV